MERRLVLWAEGDIDGLLVESRCIQSRLRKPSLRSAGRNADRRAINFAKLMMCGKVKSALRLLSSDSNSNSAPLRLDEVIDSDSKTVREVLVDKHPEGKPIVLKAIVAEDAEEEFHPVIFDRITGPLVRSFSCP